MRTLNKVITTWDIDWHPVCYMLWEETDAALLYLSYIELGIRNSLNPEYYYLLIISGVAL